MIIKDNQPTDNMREYGIISEITWVGFTGTTLDLIWFTNRKHYGITIDQQYKVIPRKVIWWMITIDQQPTNLIPICQFGIHGISTDVTNQHGSYWAFTSHNGDATDGVLRRFGCLVVVWPSPNDWLVILELNVSWHSNKVKVITQVGDLTETSNSRCLWVNVSFWHN